MNRNKLIQMFIGNLSNAILHKILERAIDIPEIALKYSKEIKNSWQIAREYRNKINPLGKNLLESDAKEIKEKITRKVTSELLLRISKGYKNINLDLANQIIEESLQEMEVS